MFKKSICIILSVILFSFFISCMSDNYAGNPSDTSSTSSAEEILKELEMKLTLLQNEYSSSNADAKAEIERLEKEIEKLKGTTSITTTKSPVTESPSIYRYRIKEGKAIITGFIGNDEKIVIPSIVDGLEVAGIDEKAFDGYKIKSVVISEGVEYIDWFAFYNCQHLTSVTIPPSVKKIGYSAFEGSSKSFTIYCHRDSFAESYAKSYGLAYAFI